jgi:type IV pilus assembly protein PilQ
MKNGFFIILFSLLFMASAWCQSIKSVNFIQEGDVSKLIIEVEGEVLADRFHVKDDQQIILDLKNVKADKKVLRGINTSEFDGATVYVSGYPKPGAPTDIRFAIQLRDNVRSILDKSGNKIILSVENRFGVFSKNRLQSNDTSVTAKAESEDLKDDNTKINTPKSTSIDDILQNLTLSGPKRYIGKKISIYVSEIPVKEILGMIADSSGFNIIIDSEVAKAPPLTLSLTNIPWDQALDTVLTISKLVAEKNSNILTVKTVENAQAEFAANAKAEELKLGLEPTVTKIFPISHSNMTDLKKILESYVSKRGSMSEDPRTNSLIIQETIGSIEQIKKIIELLDTQTPQLLIESKIVEATESYAKRIGLTNGIGFGYDPVRQGVVANTGPGFSFSTASLGNNSNTALGLNIGTFKRLTNLNVALEMLESESKVRIITAPKIVTQNKKQAVITSTETTSFAVITQQVGQPPTQTFEQIPAVLNLSVTPQVTNEGSINMEVKVSKGSFGGRSVPNGPPDLTVRDISTNVLVDNGSTVVLGGLYNTITSENHSGIPFLKDLPLVGWLFRTPHNPSTSRNELLIFLTPRIINQEEAGLINRSSDSSAKM